jgi:hypothetical protein
VVGEVALGFPGDKIGARKDADLEVDRVRHDHDPALSRLVPDNLGITKLRWVRATWNDNRVVFVLGEGVAVIARVCDMLCLVLWHVDCVHCNYAIGLVGKKSRRVVDVHDGRAGEDAFGGTAREQGNRLVRPRVKVSASRMAPVLIASNIGGWIVYTEGEAWLEKRFVCNAWVGGDQH